MSGAMGLGRVRWAAIGAALAVSLGAGGMGIVNATISSGSKAVYVPISPCRLADTRPAPDTVGSKSTPIGAGQTHTFTVRGSNGNCAIPTGATAIVANVTAVGPTAQSFMTIWPADQPQPNASSLNYSAGQAPFPNAVTVTLSGDGKIKVANKNGNVHVIVDIAGYYEDHNHDDRYDTKEQVDAKIAAIPAGPKGDTGAAGAQGPEGDTGPAGPAANLDTLDGTVCRENTPYEGVTTVLYDAKGFATIQCANTALTIQVTASVYYSGCFPNGWGGCDPIYFPIQRVVTPSVGGADVGSPCSRSGSGTTTCTYGLAAGVEVVLTPINSPAEFVGQWGGACAAIAGSDPCAVILSADTTVTYGNPTS
jgi:hypothetical protein